MQTIVKNSDRDVLKYIILKDLISKQQIRLVCEGCLMEALRELAFYLDRVIMGIVRTVTQKKSVRLFPCLACNVIKKQTPPEMLVYHRTLC